MTAINEEQEKVDLKRERARLKARKRRLDRRGKTLATPEERQQWQQQWDKMTAEKDVYFQRQCQREQRVQLKQREARLERERQERNRREEIKRQASIKLALGQELAWLSRMRAIAERKLLTSRRVVPFGGVPAPSQSSDRILQLVFSYLSPVPRHACSAKELLTHWRSLQRVTAVNRQWRAVALPALYRTACVIIGDSQGVAASASGSDEIRLRSNIDLLHAAGQADNAREVQIIVQGMGQTAGQLLRQLLLAGLGGGVVWPRAERLRIDMRDSGKEMQTNAEGENGPEALRTLNDFLSRALPSLREIEYYGDNSKAVYGCVPIEQLIKERLRGPVPLRVVRVKSDCWPKLTDDYETEITAPPIDIECMEIEGSDESYLMPVPTMVANSLVELTLLPVIDEFEWKLFEPEMDPNAPNPPLIFSSLKSLTLSSTVCIGDELPYRTQDNGYRRFNNRDDWEYEESSDNEEGKLYFDDVQYSLCTRFENFPNYEPEFPVLTHLELRYPTVSELKKFADSPISLLVLCSSSYSFKEGWDLTIFPGLRSLSFRITDAMGKSETTRFSNTLSTILPTVSPRLQQLTLAMNLDKDAQFRLSTPPPFADSLSHLTLEGEYGQHDVEHLLQLFPNLRSLSVCAIVGEPISTVPELVDEYRCANTVQLLMPLNASLHVLNVHEKRYFSGYNGWNCIPDPKRPMAPEPSHYRGLLVGLICRLPALGTLRVGSQSVDGVNESIQAIVDSGVSPEHVARLQCLRVQPLDY